ncbi:hypothetical protein EV127DRAFT_346691, partial [Xylaria flabelliformis]
TPIPTPSGNGTDATPSSSESVSVPITLPPTSTPISTPIANGTSTTPPVTSATVTSSSSQIPTNATTSEIPTSTPPPVSSSSSSVSSSVSVPLNTTEPTTSSSIPVSTSTLPPTTTTSEAVTPTSTTLVTPTTPATTVVPTSTSSKSLVTSIVATATITDSQSWLPTSLIIQEPTGTVTTGSLPTTATGIPTTLPMAISPASTNAPQPPDSTMIQISFKYGEHYMHLVEQPKAAAQLFQLLPGALAYGGGIDAKDIVMYSIRPYDTLSTLGYITSQALLYYPNAKVNQLANDIKTPNAALYNQDDQLANNLTSQINPAIPIWLGSGLDGNPSTGGSGSNSGGDGGATNSDPFGGSGGNQTTAAQKGTTAGIAIGALSVAGAYGAAMFVIARRYKRKKQRHQRSSSVSAVDEMRQAGSPPLMGGALLSRDFSSSPGYSPGYAGYGATAGENMRNSQGSGRSGTNHSARTANISAPVAAENSLGWN